MNRLYFQLLKFVNKIWFRSFLACVIAVATFFAGPYFLEYVPEGLAKIISKDGLADILTIVASSMLAVTIFSLSIVVQAFSSAANNASPRANALLMDYGASNNAMGTFLAAFLFSIAGLIGVRSNYYNDQILPMLFVMTVLLVAVIVFVFLGWIHQVVKLGRVNNTILFVEQALHAAIEDRVTSVVHDCRSLSDISNPEDFCYPIFFHQLGYVQCIDYEALKQITHEHDLDLRLDLYPGCFVSATKALMHTREPVSLEVKEQIKDAIVLDRERTFSQDPRFGFIVLTEIALKAMSPGINDPGTAVDVIGAHLTALKVWVDGLAKARLEAAEQERPQDDNGRNDADSKHKYKRIYIQQIDAEDVLEDIFGQLIIDSCRNYIVSVRLRKALETIEEFDSKDFSSHIDHWKLVLRESCEGKFSERQLERIFR